MVVHFELDIGYWLELLGPWLYVLAILAAVPGALLLCLLITMVVSDEHWLGGFCRDVLELARFVWNLPRILYEFWSGGKGAAGS